METRIDEGQRSPAPSRRDSNWLVGLALIALGAVLLSGRFMRMDDLFWSIALVGSGVTFLLVFLVDRTRWWSLIPAYVLSITGVFIWVEPLLGPNGDAIYWVTAIGVPFAVVFLSNPRQRWWALIPAYIMGMVAVFLAFERVLPPNWEGAVWTGAFAVPFLGVFAVNPRRHWWALIPAYVFSTATAFLLIERLLPGNWDGAYWTLAIAIPFLAVFVTDPRKRWWALIPAYIFGVTAVFLTVERLLRGDAAGAFWLNAIAVPFLVVFLTNPSKRWWALIPGGILIAIGIGLMVSAMSFLLPAALIAAGLILLLAQFLPRRSPTVEPVPAYGPAADRAPDAPVAAAAVESEPATGPEADHA